MSKELALWLQTKLTKSLREIPKDVDLKQKARNLGNQYPKTHKFGKATYTLLDVTFEKDDLEAKLKIVKLYLDVIASQARSRGGVSSDPMDPETLETVIRLLAVPYKHLGRYRPSWKPR